MEPFGFIDLIAMSMYLAFMPLERQSMDNATNGSKYFEILGNIDPFGLKENFFFALYLYALTLLMHAIALKIFNHVSCAPPILVEMILLFQTTVTGGSLFVCMFQTYSHFAYDGKGVYDHFVKPRGHIVLYYAFIFANNVIIIALEFLVFYFLMPQLIGNTPTTPYYKFPVFCGCGECYTLQKPLTRELLETHEKLQMRFTTIKVDETTGSEISRVKQKIFNTDSCSICLDDFPEDFDDKETLVLSCGHMFHKTCVHEWFLKEWNNAEFVNMPGVFEKIKNETKLDPVHGMMYVSWCPVCKKSYEFILCKVQ